MDDFNSLTLSGPRVVLRSVQLADVNSLFRIISDSREHLWMNQRTSVGYWISHDKARNNFVTEATAILLKYLFEKLRLHRIYIQAATGNDASNGVIRKLGFKFEGVLRENERVKEYYLDHNIYGMTEKDFLEIKSNLGTYIRK